MAKTKKIIAFVAAAIAALGMCFFSACSKKDSAGNANQSVSYSFSISKTSLSLEAGQSEKLECRYGDKKISFSSSDEQVARVSEDGTVTAVAVGVAYISAKAEGTDGAEKMCKVTVIQSDYTVSIDREGEIILLIGEAPVTLDFKATVYRNGEETSFAATFTITPAGCETDVRGGTARVTFSEVGEYVLTAAYKNASAKINIRVTDRIAD